MKSILMAALLGCLALSTGCLYANVNMPLSYRAPTPSDVTGRQTGPEVQGKSCNYIVLWLVAWGDGGYSAAVADAKSAAKVLGVRALGLYCRPIPISIYILQTRSLRFAGDSNGSLWKGMYLVRFKHGDFAEAFEHS